MTSRLSTSQVSRDVRKVMREFRRVYADAVARPRTEAAWRRAALMRQLVWRCPQRLSLADAVRCYDQVPSYNEFQPRMLRELNEAFIDAGIEVTPAREYSVAVCLHVPADNDLRDRVATFVRKRWKADDVRWTEPGILRCWWD